MPYIGKTIRPSFDEYIEKLVGEVISKSPNDTDVAGNLNYCITRLVLGVILKKFGKIRYWMSPMIRGVLKDVGDEMYDRIFRRYEDQKIVENGDIPEYILVDRHATEERFKQKTANRLD